MKSVFGILLVICLMASMVQDVAAHETIGPTKISFVSNWSTVGDLLLKTEAELANPAGCGINSSYVLPAEDSDVARALLLAALSTGSDVKLVIHGTICEDDRPRIVMVQLIGR